MMPRIKVHDVFAVPLASDAFALAQCTFVSRHFKNCIACRVFNCLYDAPRMPDTMPSSFAFDPLFLGKQVISAGTWPIVGQLDGDIAVPVFRVADGKYVGDEYVGSAGDEDLPVLEAYGPVAVQSELRRHFGIAQLTNQATNRSGRQRGL